MTTVTRRFLYIFSGGHFGTGRYTYLDPGAVRRAEDTSGQETHRAGVSTPLLPLHAGPGSVAALPRLVLRPQKYNGSSPLGGYCSGQKQKIRGFLRWVRSAAIAETKAAQTHCLSRQPSVPLMLL